MKNKLLFLAACVGSFAVLADDAVVAQAPAPAPVPTVSNACPSPLGAGFYMQGLIGYGQLITKVSGSINPADGMAEDKRRQDVAHSIGSSAFATTVAFGYKAPVSRLCALGVLVSWTSYAGLIARHKQLAPGVAPTNDLEEFYKVHALNNFKFAPTVSVGIGSTALTLAVGYSLTRVHAMRYNYTTTPDISGRGTKYLGGVSADLQLRVPVSNDGRVAFLFGLNSNFTRGNIATKDKKTPKNVNRAVKIKSLALYGASLGFEYNLSPKK